MFDTIVTFAVSGLVRHTMPRSRWDDNAYGTFLVNGRKTQHHTLSDIHRFRCTTSTGGDLDYTPNTNLLHYLRNRAPVVFYSVVRRICFTLRGAVPILKNA